MTRLLPYGPCAVLGEYDTLRDVMAVAAAVRSAQLPGVIDIVPAARTVLVTYERGSTVDDLYAILQDPTAATDAPLTDGAEVVVPVRYDGVDLADIAERCGLSVERVIAIHSDATYVSAFCGFMPGFAYLVGLDERLHLPRRTTPRTSVPAGSVAIASEFSAVYPRTSPGGWHIVGRTELSLWDDDAEQPALLAAGTKVRFEAV